MTPDDRELLELAAKAAGLLIGFSESTHDKGRPYVWNDDRKTSRWWDPLTDDGDALRLAVKLDMCLGIAPHAVALDKTSLALAPGGAEVSIKHSGDPHAATRRAVVRAAASIGKEMR